VTPTRPNHSSRGFRAVRTPCNPCQSNVSAMQCWFSVSQTPSTTSLHLCSCSGREWSVEFVSSVISHHPIMRLYTATIARMRHDIHPTMLLPLANTRIVRGTLQLLWSASCTPTAPAAAYIQVSTGAHPRALAAFHPTGDRRAPPQLLYTRP
jgi:hypothetical protein